MRLVSELDRVLEHTRMLEFVYIHTHELYKLNKLYKPMQPRKLDELTKLYNRFGFVGFVMGLGGCNSVNIRIYRIKEQSLPGLGVLEVTTLSDRKGKKLDERGFWTIFSYYFFSPDLCQVFGRV